MTLTHRGSRSVVLLTALVVGLLQLAAITAFAQDFKMIKFVIHPRTNQIIYGDEGDFHELLASQLTGFNPNEGFVWGSYLFQDGKSDIKFGTADLKTDALKRQWGGTYPAEFLKRLLGTPEGAAFHGALVLTPGGVPLGYYDSRPGRGVFVERPPALPATGGTGSSSGAAGAGSGATGGPDLPPRAARDFAWTDPRSGVVYTIPDGYADFWAKLPDSVRGEFAKADEQTRTGWASDLRLANAARDEALNRRLNALGREPTPVERAEIDAEAAQAAHRAVLERPASANRGRLARILELEAAEVARRARLALIEDTRARSVRKVQVFGDRKGSRSTLEALKADLLRQVAPMQRLNREQGTSIPVENQFLAVLDPSTGNWAFLPEAGGPNAMTMDDAILAIGSSRERVIFGHVTFREDPGRPAEWAIDLSRFPTGFSKQNLSSLKTLLEGLSLTDEAEPLAGFLVKLQGSKAFIDGDTRWWTFTADTEVLRPTTPPPATTTTSDEPFFRPPPGLPTPPPPAPEPPPDPPRAMVQEPSPLPDPETLPPPPEVAQGPIDPEFETKARALLAAWTVERLEADLAAKRFDVFKDELFRAATPEEAAMRLRTWKRLLTERGYAGHNDVLARLRFEMLLSFCEHISAQNQIRIVLIDSGKTNGFRSDLDLTIFIPFESRGSVTAAGVLNVLKAQFNALLRTTPTAIDVTLHNGDYWIPDPRNTTLSFEDHARTLHDVLRQLRENARNGVDVVADPDANRRLVQRRGLQGRAVQFVPEAEPQGFVVSDGQRVPLAAKLTVRRIPGLASEWRWRDGVGWEINSERRGPPPAVGGRDPLPDPADRFGNLKQSLTALVEKGSDPEAGAKAFGRGISALGPVNSYYEIHVSTLADTDGFGNPAGWAVLDEEIRIAFDVEEIMSGRLTTEQVTLTAHQLLGMAEPEYGRAGVATTYKESAGRKKYFKLRWIVRNLGVARPDTAEDFNEFRRIFRLMEISADMEHAKNTSQFNLKNAERGRSTWFLAYFEEARRTVDARGEFPGNVVNGDAYLDAVHAEAYRIFSADQKRLLVDAMAREMVRVLRDLTPAGMARNAMQFASPDGRPNITAARNVAQQRREQLVQLIELYESMGSDDAIRANPIEAATIRRALLEKVVELLPREVRAQVDDLMRIEEASLDNFLDSLRPEDGQVHAELEAKRIRIKAFIEAKRKRLNAIGATVAPVTDQDVKAHWLNALFRKVVPADGALAKQLTERMDQINSGRQGAVEHASGVIREVQANFAGGLVLANSLTNILRAFQATSDDDTVQRELREVMVAEFFNLYLSPKYGVVAIILKDFTRGRALQGFTSLATLGVMSSAFGLVPGLGEMYLTIELVRNNALLGYTYFSENMTNDLVEQALRSRPRLGQNLPGDRNPYRLAGAAAKPRADGREIPIHIVDRITSTTSPLFPLLFEYSECGDPAAAGLNWGRPVTLATPFDRMSLEELIPLAQKHHGAAIWKWLLERNMTPKDVSAATYLGVPFVGIRQLAESNANFERDRLERMYAFDLPYVHRMRKIWECFFPTLVKRRQQTAINPTTADELRAAIGGARGSVGAVDDDVLLEQIFTEVVEKWLSQQQNGYAEQFNSLLDAFQRPREISPPDATSRSRFIRVLVATLIDRYKAYELIGPATSNELDELGREALSAKKELDTQERRAIGMKRTTIDALGQRLEQHVAGLASQARKEVPPAAWLSAPSYYVPLKPAGLASTGTRLTGSNAGRLDAELPSDRSDILVNIQADRSRHPTPWSAKYAVAIASCDPNWQSALPGLRFNAAEQQLLNQKDASGRAAYQITVVNFNASAEVVDARGQRFASTKVLPLRGYVIDPVPQVRRELTVRIDTRVSGATIRSVSANVRAGAQTKSAIASTSEPGILLATFSGFEPGSYDVQVTPEGNSFGAANASATFATSPPSSQACAIDEEKPQLLTVNVRLPYTPPATTTAPAAPATPAAATTTTAVPAPPANAEQACLALLNDALDRKDRGDISGAQRALERARTPCASVPGAASTVTDVATAIGGNPSTSNTTPASTGVNTPGVGPRAPTSPTTPPPTPSVPPTVGRGPTTPTSPNTQLANECAQIVAKATELLAQGNAGLAANWLGQAQQKGCAAAGPQLGAAVTEQLGNLEGILQGLIEACDLVSAFSVAQQARAAFALDPRLTVWLDRNLLSLQRQAAAQRRAQELVAAGQAAIQQRRVTDAMTALLEALALPDLPPCMRESITALLGDLTRRVFGPLTTDLIRQTDDCEVDQALQTWTLIEALQPRDEAMQAWFRSNRKSDLDALKKRFETAKRLKEEAEALSRTATTQAQWDAIISKLELARGTALGCGKKLDLDNALTTARGKRPLTPPPPPSIPPTPPMPPRPPVTPPVTPPPLPPAASLQCTIVASPDLGYQGDQVEVTIEIDPRAAAQVTQVITSNPGCPGCPTTKAAAGRFTQTLFLTGQPEISLVSRKPAPLSGGGGSFTSALPGFEKRVSVRFVASDAANRQVCSGTADVKFAGTRQ